MTKIQKTKAKLHKIKGWLITHKGITKPAKYYADALGYSENALNIRLANMPVEEAITRFNFSTIYNLKILNTRPSIQRIIDARRLEGWSDERIYELYKGDLSNAEETYYPSSNKGSEHRTTMG